MHFGRCLQQPNTHCGNTKAATALKTYAGIDPIGSQQSHTYPAVCCPLQSSSRGRGGGQQNGGTVWECDHTQLQENATASCQELPLKLRPSRRARGAAGVNSPRGWQSRTSRGWVKDASCRFVDPMKPSIHRFCRMCFAVPCPQVVRW